MLSEPISETIVTCDFNNKETCGYTVWNDFDYFHWERFPREALKDMRLKQHGILKDGEFNFVQMEIL